MLLNDGLETICEGCFSCYSLKNIDIPSSVRRVGKMAFYKSPLEQVHFLGAVENTERGTTEGAECNVTSSLNINVSAHKSDDQQTENLPSRKSCYEDTKLQRAPLVIEEEAFC